MVYKSKPRLIHKLWDAKVELDMFMEAEGPIRIGDEADTIKKFNIKYNQVKEEYQEHLLAVVKEMTLSSNLVKLDGSWYLIRYQKSNGDMEGAIYPLVDNRIHVIEVDGRHERELTESEFNKKIQEVMDVDQLNEYEEASRECIDLVLSKLVEEPKARKVKEDEDNSSGVVEEQPEPKGITASYHSIERYIERVMGIKGKINIDRVIASDKDRIVAEIVHEAESSVPVWEDSDTLYWFNDATNIMYVLGLDLSVITLYEEDFGFSKEINNSIVHQQLEVLRESKDKLDASIEAGRELRGQIEADSGELRDQIKSLQLEVAVLQARLDANKEEIEVSQREESLIRHEYRREHNKLFKKWER